jgi:mannitol-specific phosphotransferase system IIBC component
MRRFKEDVRIIALWILLMAQTLIGFELLFNDHPEHWRIIGAALLIGAFVMLGLWVRWCVRVAVRDRTYLVCDNCGTTGRGRHRR